MSTPPHLDDVQPTRDDARHAVACAETVLDQAITTAKGLGPSAHDHQVFLYDLSHAAAGMSMCKTALTYAEIGDDEAHLANVFIGRVIAQLASTLWTSHQRWGVEIDALMPAQRFAAAATASDYIAAAAEGRQRSNLSDDLSMVAHTFRRFAEDKIVPHAERIH